MSSESDRNMDTYLGTGVATDIGTSQLKAMEDFHKRRIEERASAPSSASSGPDGIERAIANVYFSIPRSVFFGLAILGAILGYLSSAYGNLTIGDFSATAVAGIGGVTGYAVIPAIYIAIRLGYWALKLAIGFALIYLFWLYILQPWLEGRSPI